MPSPTIIHWLVLILAGLLALAGLHITFRALFRDRSRGRRRCPKCWYDMTGVAGLKCPECGREARYEKRLLKTRRRYRRAIIGATLILLGISIAYGQSVYEKGWTKGVPTIGYVAALPWLDAQSDGLTELKRRIEKGEPRQWEYSLLVRRLIAWIPQVPDPQTKVDLIDMLAGIENLGRVERGQRPYLSWARISQAASDEAVEMLAALAGDPDEDVSSAAMDAILVFRRSVRRAILPILRHADAAEFQDRNRLAQCFEAIRRIDSGLARNWAVQRISYVYDGTTEIGALSTIVAAGPSEGVPVRELIGALDDESSRVRTHAVWLLCSLAPDDALARDAILARYDTQDVDLRTTILGYAVNPPISDRMQAVVRSSLQRGERLSALRVIEDLGHDGHVFKDPVRGILDGAASNPGWYPVALICQVARTWVAIGGDTKVAIGVVRELLISPAAPKDSQSQVQLAECLASMGGTAPELIPDLELVINASNAPRDVGSQVEVMMARGDAVQLYWLIGGDPVQAARLLMTFTEGKPRYRMAPNPSDVLERIVRASPAAATLLEAWLEHDDFRQHAIRILSTADVNAAHALPALRRLRDDPNAAIAAQADHAVRRIEWSISHPDEARLLREEQEQRWSPH